MRASINSHVFYWPLLSNVILKYWNMIDCLHYARYYFHRDRFNHTCSTAVSCITYFYYVSRSYHKYHSIKHQVDGQSLPSVSLIVVIMQCFHFFATEQGCFAYHIHAGHSLVKARLGWRQCKRALGVVRGRTKKQNKKRNGSRTTQKPRRDDNEH